MIRINLLREPQGKPRRPRRGMGKIILVAVIVIAVGAAGGALWMFRSAIFRAAAPAPKKDYAVKQEAAPSTYSREGMVEDVVKEVSDAGQKLSSSGMLSLPYEELSFSEKINYEVLFAKNVVELLGRAVPAGIGLRSLESDNFQTVYAVGIAPSRELVESVFAALKAEKVTLLPRPLTMITPNGRDGFKFAFTGKPEFGLNLTDSIMDAPFIADRDLPRVLQAMERSARENSITIVKGPVQVSSEKVGAYYRHLYKWSGQGSYRNFVKFVMHLYQARQFCAFKRISVNAQSGASVKIESQVLITTRQ
jgi:hypothetical protein